MYATTFIKLVEDEYMNLLMESSGLKEKNGLKKGELPEYICSSVQKFRNWLTFAMRTSDIDANGVSVKAADFIIYSATGRALVQPYELLHPKLISALSLFRRDEFDELFGKGNRDRFERGTGVLVSICQFRVCYDHCQEVARGGNRKFWRSIREDVDLNATPQ